MEKFKCPNCSEEMNFLTFMKAPTPWHLKCKNCHQKLKLSNFRIISTVIALFAGMLFGWLSILAYEATGVGIYGVIVFFLALLIFECVGYYTFKKMGIKLETK